MNEVDYRAGYEGGVLDTLDLLRQEVNERVDALRPYVVHAGPPVPALGPLGVADNSLQDLLMELKCAVNAMANKKLTSTWRTAK